MRGAMFTGIVTGIGRLKARSGGVFEIVCDYEAATIDIGASIACDGCCLTVTHLESIDNGACFRVDVSNETLSCSCLGDWCVGNRINLERALVVGAELGGHIVTGHIDGVARLVEMHDEEGSRHLTIEAPEELARFIAKKGSVTLAGTSLTVNEVAGNCFGVNLVPHTLKVTTWRERQVGDRLNIEVDLLARYVARLWQFTREVNSEHH